MTNRNDGRETYKEDQYRVIIFVPDREYPVKYRKQEIDKPHKLQQLLDHCDRNFPGWTAINVYGGLSREFKKQLRPKK